MENNKQINEFGPTPDHIREIMSNELPALLQPAMDFIEKVYLEEDDLHVLVAADKVFERLTHELRERHRNHDTMMNEAKEKLKTEFKRYL